MTHVRVTVCPCGSTHALGCENGVLVFVALAPNTYCVNAAEAMAGAA